MGFLRGSLRKVIRKTVRSAAKEVFRPITNQIKGSVGEAKVSAKLNPIFFDDVEHRQINDLVIIDGNGKSHQIDHVEIRENGIFCIETKNYSGWIFGNEKQEYWTQILGDERYKMLNPIKQNKSHVYYLSKVLNNEYKINSVVVMTQNNADRINAHNVVNLRDLRRYLASFENGVHLSIKEMDVIYQRLNAANNHTISNSEHIHNINNTQMKVDMNICPRCNGVLVLKNGKYGPFYGCSSYPSCKFTKKL